MGIELDVRNDAHNDDDEEEEEDGDEDEDVENVGEEFEDESGDEVAWGMGIAGETGWLEDNPSNWRKIKAT